MQRNRTFALSCLLLTATIPTLRLQAQTTAPDSAQALWDKGKHQEATVILERLVKAGSSDANVHFLYGFALIEQSKVLDDSLARRKARSSARAEFGRAIELGSKSQQARAMFASIPPDGGGDVSFSSNPAIDSAMQAAEKAYASGDMRAALQGYARALALDPGEYSAALFSGDAYMRLSLLDSTYLFYRRATEINPARETAWRYWSGVLLKNGNRDEARDKAIEAIVAEPYNRLSRTGLASWGSATRTSLAPPRVVLPLKDSSTTHTKHWIAYDSARKAQGVDAPGHRHTMIEERDALLAASRASPDDIDVLNIKRMQEAGQLESFIYFFRVDAGIASEYESYRATHHDQLKKFWEEWVVGAKYAR